MKNMINKVKEFFINNSKLLIFSFVIGILIHGYKIVHYLPTWDSMYFIVSPLITMLGTGRWLSGIVSALMTSYYDLQFLEGILTFFVFSIVNVLIFETLEIKDMKIKVIASILFMAFPSVASLLCYMNWALVYALSYLMAVLSVYLSIHGKKSIINKFIICILICCSMGIYQIYVPVSSILFIYYYVRKLVQGDKISKYSKDILSYIGCGLIGCIGYYVILKIFLGIFSISLGDYQGVSSAFKISIRYFISSIYKVIVSFIVFHTGGRKVSWYLFINGITLILMLVVWIKVIFNKKVKSKLLVILLVGATIFITYIFLMASSDTYYHMIMQSGNYFIYIGTLMVGELLNKDSKVLKCLLGCLVFLSFYHFVNANKAYKVMELSYSSVSYQVSNTLSKIDSLSNNGQEEIIILGECFLDNDIINTIPEITGSNMPSFIISPYHFKVFTKYYYNREYNIINDDIITSDEEIEKYISIEEYNAMDTYPYGEYVIKKDNLIIVKFS